MTILEALDLYLNSTWAKIISMAIGWIVGRWFKRNFTPEGREG